MSERLAEHALEDKLDDSFFMYRAKVEMCSRQDVHACSACPYLHPNELASRRDPQVFKYDAIFCYDLHNNKVCSRGVSCPYSHNLFEYFLHPSRYRTRLCEYGEDCKRELCFFAHNEQQLRPRTAIKVYSGGRRSGKQHRAAAARAAVLAAAAGSMYGSHSPKVEFLEVPALQPMGCSGQAHWVLAGPRAQAVSGWQALEFNYQQQQQAETGMYPTSVSMQQLQREPPSIMVLQQPPYKASTMEIPCPVGFGCTPPSAGVTLPSSMSSALISSDNVLLVPSRCMEVQPSSAAVMSPAMLEPQQTLVAAPCNLASRTLPQEWSVMSSQQQVLMAATQQCIAPQQQQLQQQVLAPHYPVDVLQHQLQGLQLQQPQVVAAPQTLQQLVQLVASGPTDAFVSAMGQQQQSCTTPGGQVAAVNLVQSAGGVTGRIPGMLASSGCSPVESCAGIAALMTASGAPVQAVSQQQQLNLLMAASMEAQGVSAAFTAQQQPMLACANWML